MKLLVTGGAGFIGSNFIRLLLKEGARQYKILNYDKLTYAGNLDNLRDIAKNPFYDFIKGDICDEEKLNKTISKFRPDAVLNFAAETHVDRSIISGEDFIQTNVYGTYRILEAVKSFAVNRYIQISTDEVYGSISKGSFTEKSPLAPNSPYASAKAGADLLCRSYFITYKLPILITRSSNNYGPYQYPEKVIPLFITNAIENKPLPLYGDGKNIRDWLYVEDNCRAIELVLLKGKPGQIYNIGGGTEVKNIQLAKTILDLLGKPRSLIKKVKDRPGHDKRYSLDFSKIKRLGYKPRTSFPSGIRKTLEWYINNRNWWEKLKDRNFHDYYKKQYHKR